VRQATSGRRLKSLIHLCLSTHLRQAGASALHLHLWKEEEQAFPSRWPRRQEAFPYHFLGLGGRAGRKAFTGRHGRRGNGRRDVTEAGRENRLSQESRHSGDERQALPARQPLVRAGRIPLDPASHGRRLHHRRHLKRRGGGRNSHPQQWQAKFRAARREGSGRHLHSLPLRHLSPLRAKAARRPLPLPRAGRRGKPAWKNLPCSGGGEVASLPGRREAASCPLCLPPPLLPSPPPVVAWKEPYSTFTSALPLSLPQEPYSQAFLTHRASPHLPLCTPLSCRLCPTSATHPPVHFCSSWKRQNALSPGGMPLLTSAHFLTSPHLCCTQEISGRKVAAAGEVTSSAWRPRRRGRRQEEVPPGPGSHTVGRKARNLTSA